MKRPTTKRPLTPAEERRLLSGVPAPAEETAGVKRWAGKKGRGTVGEREVQQRLLREDNVSRSSVDGSGRR